MSKEFIINDRKLATVECDVEMCNCPVFRRVFDVENKDLPLFATTYRHSSGAGIRMETVPDKLCTLRADVMNTCMECNAKAR